MEIWYLIKQIARSLLSPVALKIDSKITLSSLNENFCSFNQYRICEIF